MSLTGANAVITLSVPNLFVVPQQLQQFDVDNVFSGDALESAETVMGVDGFMSAGFVFVKVTQQFHLMADSPSIRFFDDLWSAQQQIRDIYRINGTVLLTTLGKKWVMTRGVLSNYKPIPDIKKLLQGQNFTITWERLIPSIGLSSAPAI